MTCVPHRLWSTACLWALTPTDAFAQQLGQGGGIDIAPWRVIITLSLCLGMAVAGAFALRWKMQRGTAVPFTSQRRLRLVERLRLSHQVDICLVQCDGREFIVTTSPRDTHFGPQLPLPDTVTE